MCICVCKCIFSRNSEHDTVFISPVDRYGYVHTPHLLLYLSDLFKSSRPLQPWENILTTSVTRKKRNSMKLNLSSKKFSIERCPMEKYSIFSNGKVSTTAKTPGYKKHQPFSFARHFLSSSFSIGTRNES